MLARRLLMGGSGSGIPGWTRGTVTPDGTPVTVLANGSFNSQPGVCWLDPSRIIVTYAGSSGYLWGIIGTKTGTWTFSYGSPFTIRAVNSNDYDDVSVIDGKLVATGNLFSVVNSDPFILICDDPPSSASSASSWSAPIALPPGSGLYDRVVVGPVRKLIDGAYLAPLQTTDGSGYNGDAVMLSSSVTDWSGASTVMVGTNGAVTYTEIVVDEWPDGTLYAWLRTETPEVIYKSTSTDHGATWGAPVSAFTGYGYPMVKRLTTGILLAVYRQTATLPAEGETYWRQSVDDGATWSAETLLDGTDIGGQPSYSAYATILQLDSTHALCVYSIGDLRGGAFPANLYSQVFTDSSTRP